jgi:hypothetical protein
MTTDTPQDSTGDDQAAQDATAARRKRIRFTPDEELAIKAHLEIQAERDPWPVVFADFASNHFEELYSAWKARPTSAPDWVKVHRWMLRCRRDADTIPELWAGLQELRQYIPWLVERNEESQRAHLLDVLCDALRRLRPNPPLDVEYIVRRDLGLLPENAQGSDRRKAESGCTAIEVAHVIENNAASAKELKKRWDGRRGFYPHAVGKRKVRGGNAKTFEPRKLLDRAVAAQDVRQQDIPRILRDLGLAPGKSQRQLTKASTKTKIIP